LVMRKLFVLIGVFCLGVFVEYKVEYWATHRPGILYAHRLYGTEQFVPKVIWDKVCWGRALKSAKTMSKRRDVKAVRVITGDFGAITNHAWVEYLTKDNVVIGYDPRTDDNMYRRELNE